MCIDYDESQHKKISGAQLKFIRYPHRNPMVQPSVVTVGNFDGLHLGHQALINKVVHNARAKNLQAAVVTMQPMASQYFQGKHKVAVLSPFKLKYLLIKKMDVDVMCVLNFNHHLASLNAEDFIQSILLDGLKAKHIIIGDDFRFGKNRAGDFNMLKQYCQSKGVKVQAMSSVVVEGQRVSSSLIRERLSLGQFDQVQRLLGRRYSISGKVSKGQQLGRQLGYPTINIKLKSRTVPIAGIFCVSVTFEKRFEGKILFGSASLGTRPTVNGEEQILEVYILDFNDQVYGENVEVLFHHKIRNEVKFEGIKELKRHINNDVIKTRLFFKNYHE